MSNFGAEFDVVEFVVFTIGIDFVDDLPLAIILLLLLLKISL
jgi:hypothetical protein